MQAASYCLHKKPVCERHDCPGGWRMLWVRREVKTRTAKQHVRQCQLLEKPCDLCHQSLKRQDLQQHVQECPFRDIVCACGTRIKKKDEENHVATTCAFKEEPCPLNCGATVRRSVKIFTDSSHVIIFQD